MVPGAEVETSPEAVEILTPSVVVAVAEAVADVVAAEVASTAEAMNSPTVVASEVAKAEEAMVAAATPCASPTSSTLTISIRPSRCVACPSR